MLWGRWGGNETVTVFSNIASLAGKLWLVPHEELQSHKKVSGLDSTPVKEESFQGLKQNGGEQC